MPKPQPLKPGDMERMMKEADERWANRPRPLPREGDDPRLEFAELKYCSLPNGGVSDGVRAQLERNRIRREEEAARKRAEQEQEDMKEL